MGVGRMQEGRATQIVCLCLAVLFLAGNLAGLDQFVVGEETDEEVNIEESDCTFYGQIEDEDSVQIVEEQVFDNTGSVAKLEKHHYDLAEIENTSPHPRNLDFMWVWVLLQQSQI